MLSYRNSLKYILASLQTNMAKSQISRVDIRIGKGGLDQSQTKNKLGEAFFKIKYHKLFKKFEKFYVWKKSSKKRAQYSYLAIYPIAVYNSD